MTESHSKTIQRRAVGAMFFMIGICFSSWASQIPHFQKQLNLSDAELGFVLFSIPLGRFISMPLVGWLVSTFGSRILSIVSILSYSSLLCVFGIAQNTYQFMPMLFLLGFVYNVVIISLNTQAVIVGKLYTESIMASFHGLWSLAGAAGSLLAMFLIGRGFETLEHFVLVGIIILVSVFICIKYLPDEIPPKEKKPFFALPDKSLVLLGAIAFCCMMCEGAMYDWSGIYFAKIVQVDKTIIGLGYTALMVTMAIGRFASDRYTTRYGLRNTMRISGLFITVGLLVVVCFPQLIPSTIGFLVVGIGVSAVVPMAYAGAGQSPHIPAPIAITMVSTIGFLGFIVGPPLIGLVAEVTSLRGSFAIVALTGVGIFVLGSRLKETDFTPKK